MLEAIPETIPRRMQKETKTAALLDRLRNETYDEHRLLEDRLDLLRAGLPLATYGKILGRFYGFYRPWESSVAPLASGILPDFETRQKKVHNLIADLEYLGIEFSSLPLCGTVPPCDNLASVLGGLYVTEGATLGGQVISRHLRPTYEFAEGRGDAFFPSYGEKVGLCGLRLETSWRRIRHPRWTTTSSTQPNELFNVCGFGCVRPIHERRRGTRSHLLRS